VITYENAFDLWDAVSKLPLEKLLIETDCVFFFIFIFLFCFYLQHHSWFQFHSGIFFLLLFIIIIIRGQKRNSHSGMIPKIMEHVSYLQKIPLPEVYQQIRKNVTFMYGV
jgi:Tat protein secretion system quality control protein TatD with DNase activity